MFLRHRVLMFVGSLLVLATPAAFAFLVDDVPRTNDLASHVYRAFELEQLLKSGFIFPRWGPQLVHGYGYPVFNYFPYLSHYFIVITHLLTGISLVWSYKVVAVLVVYITFLGAFLLGRDLYEDENSGIFTAVSFVYSPYLLMTNNIRGGLPEAFALASLPFCLWAWVRLIRGERIFVIWAGITYAVMILSHNGSAVQISILIVMYALFYGRNQIVFVVKQLCIATFIGIGLSAFYWLPALLELQYAQVASGYASTGIVFHQNFTDIAGLFKYPAFPVDSDLINPTVSNPLGIASILFSLIAISRMRLTINKHFVETRVTVFIAMILLFLVLPQSDWVWESIVLLQLTLWPWRFVGPVSLLLGLVGASLFVTINKRTSIILMSCLFTLIVNGLPWMYPPRESLVSPRNVEDLARFEMIPWLIGTSSTAEYVPVWVKELPDTSNQQKLLYDNSDPDRLDRNGLPTTANVVHIENSILSDRYQINSTNDLVLSFNHFFFPGWRAWIDDNPAPIVVSQPHGLMKVFVPAGQSTLKIAFDSTVVRDVASIVSLVVFILVVMMLIGSNLTNQVYRIKQVNLKQQIVFGCVVLVLFLISSFVDNPIRKSGLGSGKGPLHMDNQLSIDLGGELLLHGYSVSRDIINADDGFELDLFWQPQKKIGVVYAFNIRLVDLQGHVWNVPEIVRPEGWRFIPGTDHWPPDKYVMDQYFVQPITGTPPGKYFIKVVAFRQDNLEELASNIIGEINIIGPDRSSFERIKPLVDFVDNDWLIWEFLIDKTDVVSGEGFTVQVVWNGVEAITSPYYLQLNLVDMSNNKVQSTFQYEIGVNYSPKLWKLGDRIRDQYFALVPADLPAGKYKWLVELIGPEDRQLGSFVYDKYFEVTVPDRLFEPPDDINEVGIVLEDLAILSGYTIFNDFNEVDKSIEVTLVWNSSANLTESYRVFVHLVDELGNLISQSDNEPDEWNRPTTGWLSGEYINDTHKVVVPEDLNSGIYSIYVGLYNPTSLQRLSADGFDDGYIKLTEIYYSND